MKCALNGAVLWMKIAISWTWKRLKINNVFITLNDVDQKAKKKNLIYEMCLLFVIFGCPKTVSSWTTVCFERCQHRKANITIFIVLVKIFSADTFSRTVCSTIQYVAQYPDGTSIRTLKTKTHFLRRRFQFSVNEVFRMKARHFIFKVIPWFCTAHLLLRITRWPP